MASVWGTLDTQIDGRINNPVTNPAALEGFHRIEEIMWTKGTLSGVAGFCNRLVKNEQQLHTLVATASYNPVTMASGATDLINEAGDSKISGEEERYSNTDFIVFQANVDGAMEVVNLLKPYLQQADPALLNTVEQRHATVEAAIAQYQATPGYDHTGYVEYSTVVDSQRRQLSGVVQAFAEALSKIPGQVGNPHHPGEPGRRPDDSADRSGPLLSPHSARRSRDDRGRTRRRRGHHRPHRRRAVSGRQPAVGPLSLLRPPPERDHHRRPRPAGLLHLQRGRGNKPFGPAPTARPMDRGRPEHGQRPTRRPGR